MSRVVAVWIECDADGCDGQHPLDLGWSTVGPVREQAKRLGWEHRRIGKGYVDLCPEHARKARP